MHPNRRLLIVDDDPAIRASWRRNLGIFHHVAVAATLAEARARLASERYDVVVLDVRLRRERGTDLLDELDPSVAVLVVSGAFDDGDEAAIAGRAHATFAKGTPIWRLREAIDRAYERCHGNLDVALRRFANAFGLRASTLPFLDLVVRSLTYEQIAQELGCAPGTVKNRMRDLLHRTGCRDRADLAARILVRHDRPEKSTRAS